MTLLNKSITSTFFINIIVVLTLFLPLNYILCSVGYENYYYIINSFKPCLVKILIFFSLGKTYPKKGVLFKLYLSSALTYLLLGTVFNDVFALYLSVNNVPSKFIICCNNNVDSKMSIAYLLSPTPYNHNQWMALTRSIREGVRLKLLEDQSNNITNRTYYLTDITKFLTKDEKSVLNNLPGFNSRTVRSLQIHGRLGIREDTLSRIYNNY
jgi:hypothetical protein